MTTKRFFDDSFITPGNMGREQCLTRNFGEQNPRQSPTETREASRNGLGHRNGALTRTLPSMNQGDFPATLREKALSFGSCAYLLPCSPNRLKTENPRYFLATNQRDPWIKMVLIIRSVATRFVKVSVKEQFSAFFNAAKTEH